MYSNTALSPTRTVKEKNQIEIDQQVYLKNIQAHSEHSKKNYEMLHTLQCSTNHILSE